MNLRLTVSLLSIACSLSHAADAPPRFTAPDAPRRLIFNDDGHGVFYGGQAHDAASLRKGPLALRDTHVGIFQWGVTVGTKVNYPSKIAELVGEGMTPAQLAAVRTGDRVVIGKLAQLRDEGIDTLATIAEGCHAADLRCFASVRMNPVYPIVADGWEGESMARMFNSRFWWEHPEFRVIKRTGTPHLTLSYAFPQVRERVLAIVREVLERDIDGIDLDFLRHPPFVGHEDAVVAAYRASTGLDAFAVPENDPAWLRFRAQHVTQLVRDIRRELDAAAVRKGRALGLSARLDHERHLLWGCDLDAWLKEDLLDILVVSRHGLGGWEFDLRTFVEKARGTHCKIWLGEEATIAGRDPQPSDEVKGKVAKPTASYMTEAMWLERARNWYAQGASGIHIFNSAPQAVLKTLGALQPIAPPFSATISPMDEAQQGQWNVALAELTPGHLFAIWEAGNTEVKTANVMMCATSDDGGRTWSGRREFFKRDAMRCTPCGFYRSAGVLHCVHGELPMAGGTQPCRIMDRASSDNGATWGEAREIWQTKTGVAMQPVVLRDGRIALPVYHVSKADSGAATNISRVLLSSDSGATWKETAGSITTTLPGGAMEPTLGETRDGSWLCILRTRGTGLLQAARSTNSGATWSAVQPLPLESPESIPKLQTLADGSLLVVWNGVASKTQGPRNVLTAARSTDGGITWPQRRDIVTGGFVLSNHGVLQSSAGSVLVGYQDLHRDPVRAPQRGGVDSVELVGFELPWLGQPPLNGTQQ